MTQNKNWRVVVLVTTCFIIYFLFSIISNTFGLKWIPFERVNLVSDLLKNAINKETKIQKKYTLKTENPTQDFELYKKPQFITNFYKGNQVNALANLSEKLYQLKKNKTGKIRIAYFGDSMIEGDLLTQNLRKLLQQEFGGSGVGYLPIHSNVDGFRQTAYTKSNGWEIINFMEKGAKNMYISGYSFSGPGTGKYTDNTISAPTKLQKYFIFGKSDADNSINFNGTKVSLNTPDLVNFQILANDNSTSFEIKNNSPNLPIYGVSFESENGVILDNFSFRGITGVEFRKIDEDFLKSIQKSNHYDLIVMQYGVNLLFRPNDTDYSYYTKMMTPVLQKFRSAFPKTDILLVSSADRAFRYNGEYKTAIGMPNLLETQAKLAFDNHLEFFNLYETMGGENSIVNWATQNPPLANKDYVHPNGKGADILGEKIFEAIVKDYKNYKPKKEITE